MIRVLLVLAAGFQVNVHTCPHPGGSTYERGAGMTTTAFLPLKNATPPDAKFLRQAIDEAIEGPRISEGGPFGALIVKDGKIISKVHNMVIAEIDPTAHAEVTAIRRAAKALGTTNLTGCVLYTSAYPCPMCMGAALWASLDAVYYGASTTESEQAGWSDKAFYEFIKDPKSNSDRIIERVPVKNPTEPFDIWNAMPEKPKIP